MTGGSAARGVCVAVVDVACRFDGGSVGWNEGEVGREIGREMGREIEEEKNGDCDCGGDGEVFEGAIEMSAI